MRVLLSFRSRSQTFQCVNYLRANGYPASISDTPLSLHGSCALSVYTDYDGFVFFSSYSREYSAFTGAYKCEGGRISKIF